MELSEIMKKISQVSNDDKNVADMLKEIFIFQRSSTGNYKSKYREIIEKNADKED